MKTGCSGAIGLAVLVGLLPPCLGKSAMATATVEHLARQLVLEIQGGSRSAPTQGAVAAALPMVAFRHPTPSCGGRELR